MVFINYKTFVFFMFFWFSECSHGIYGSTIKQTLKCNDKQSPRCDQNKCTINSVNKFNNTLGDENLKNSFCNYNYLEPDGYFDTKSEFPDPSNNGCNQSVGMYGPYKKVYPSLDMISEETFQEKQGVQPNLFYQIYRDISDDECESCCGSSDSETSSDSSYEELCACYKTDSKSPKADDVLANKVDDVNFRLKESGTLAKRIDRFSTALEKDLVKEEKAVVENNQEDKPKESQIDNEKPIKKGFYNNFVIKKLRSLGLTNIAMLIIVLYLVVAAIFSKSPVQLYNKDSSEGLKVFLNNPFCPRI